MLLYRVGWQGPRVTSVSCCYTGWGGKGLGSTEQGRMDPVETAEVRDKADMYRGIGIAVNDPFEQFRKSKAKGFVQRMRAKEDA